MLTLSDYLISSDSSIRDALLCIDKSGAGICIVVDTDKHLLGIATDGDIRRFLIEGQDISLPIVEAMNNLTRNIEIRVGYTRPWPPGSQGALITVNSVCGSFEGPGQADTTSTIECQTPLEGRFITLQAKTS